MVPNISDTVVSVSLSPTAIGAQAPSVVGRSRVDCSGKWWRSVPCHDGCTAPEASQRGTGPGTV